jgi:hypothetical protein
MDLLRTQAEAVANLAVPPQSTTSGRGGGTSDSHQSNMKNLCMPRARCDLMCEMAVEKAGLVAS